MYCTLRNVFDKFRPPESFVRTISLCIIKSAPQIATGNWIHARLFVRSETKRLAQFNIGLRSFDVSSQQQEAIPDCANSLPHFQDAKRRDLMKITAGKACAHLKEHQFRFVVTVNLTLGARYLCLFFARLCPESVLFQAWHHQTNSATTAGTASFFHYDFIFTFAISLALEKDWPIIEATVKLLGILKNGEQHRQNDFECSICNKKLIDTTAIY